MKNRDRYILKVNEYDMLIKIQATMLSHNCCVIEALAGVSCPNEKKCMLSNCRRCIQAWLNKEEI
jgi:hypothetical protein